MQYIKLFENFNEDILEKLFSLVVTYQEENISLAFLQVENYPDIKEEFYQDVFNICDSLLRAAAIFTGQDKTHIDNVFKVIDNSNYHFKKMMKDKLDEDYLFFMQFIKLGGKIQTEVNKQTLTSLFHKEYLYMDNKKITEIPESIGKLKNLKSLYMELNIKKLPNSITKLSGLRQLILQFNPLEELPKDIGELDSLSNLNIRGTNVKEIPESFYKIFEKPSFKILNIQGCDIPQDQIDKLIKLKKYSVIK